MADDLLEESVRGLRHVMAAFPDFGPLSARASSAD
jgi:hypothetical protein